MSRQRRARLAVLLTLAVCAVAAVAAPAADARPREPMVIYPPPVPPPMPGVGLGEPFIRDAAAYLAFTRDASAISPNFTNSNDVGAALQVGTASEPAQLRRGAVTYAAIAVLGDAAFVAAVRAAGPTPESRYAIQARIYADPAYALSFADGTTAEGLAKQALTTTGMGLYAGGGAVAGAAYSIQHQPWSLVEAPQHDARISLAKRLSMTPRKPDGADETELQRRVLGDLSGAPALAPAPGPYSGLVVRAVALAALAAIGEAGDAQAASLGWLTDDYYMDHCVAETKLSLFECLAVAKPNYEDVFCLGQHALKDTGACLVRSAYGATPLVIATAPLHVPPAHIGARPARVVRHRRG